MYSIRSILAGQRPSKKRKIEHLSPITFGRIKTRLSNGRPRIRPLKILLDSGSSSTLISSTMTKNLRNKAEKETSWVTAAGEFKTQGHCKVLFQMPEFHESKTIQYDVHVTTQNMGYDMIIGRDLLHELGITMTFAGSESSMTWNESTIPMKPMDAELKTSCHIQDSPSIAEATERLKRILDAKYEKADLEKICAESTHLSDTERETLLKVLRKHEKLFDGTLGYWKGKPYDIELKPDATPYHAKPYPIPKAYERQLKLEVKRLCEIGVLKKI